MATPLVAFALSLLVAPQSGTSAPQPPLDENRFGRPPNHRPRVPPTAPDTGSTKGGTRGAPPFTPPNNTNVQVSSPSTADQDETPIDVDPSDRNHLIGGANDNRQGPYACAFYASFDAGLTWSELLFPDPDGFGQSADPAVGFGPNGQTYFLALAYSGSSAIYLGSSSDGGLSVPTWIKAVKERNQSFEDKPGMAVDTTGSALSKAIYVTWTRFNNIGGVPIMVTASFDDGATWSPATRVSDSSFCQGSCPAVGPNGELYVAFLDSNDGTIKFDSSPDGGVTWGTDVKISDVRALNSVPHTFFRTNSFPSLDVDTSGGPFNGRIYACWAADTDPSGTLEADVLIASSSDNGVTWSTPIPASDVTTNSQFCPWLDVDANGNVNVGFYDRRDDVNDIRLRYYVARSSDGGVTFQPNVKASDASFNPNRNPQGGFIGDYTGLAASDRSIHGIWTDERNGDNDAYTARVQLDLHTDVASISAATGGTAAFTLNPGPLYQNADYRLLGSISGTSPGINFNGVNVPLNYDLFMLVTIFNANSSALPGFLGTLDATGTASAALVSGPLPPAVVGLQMDFAAFVKVGGAVRWASNPTHLEIGN